MDSETGMYYLMSRYYDPVTHRFLNADGYFQTSTNVLDANMNAYCRNNPVNYADYTGHSSLVASIVNAAKLGASIGLSAAAPKSAPKSIVGAAQPYINMKGSSNKNSPNCYAYAIGSSVNEQPGGASGRIPTNYNNVYDVGKSVESDLIAKGMTVRVIASPYELIYDNEFRIALRVGTSPCIKDSGGNLYYDYHFMRQTDTGQWAEKHGIGGDSVLWDPGMTPDDIPWTLNGSPYYDSDIIYYAVGN